MGGAVEGGHAKFSSAHFNLFLWQRFPCVNTFPLCVWRLLFVLKSQRFTSGKYSLIFGSTCRAALCVCSGVAGVYCTILGHRPRLHIQNISSYVHICFLKPFLAFFLFTVLS